MQGKFRPETVFFCEKQLWNKNMAKKRAAFEIVNERGFHARPVSLFVQCASGFCSAIEVKNLSSGIVADGKSLMSLLILAAAKGTVLEITASGADAEIAVDTLGKLIMGGFDED